MGRPYRGSPPRMRGKDCCTCRRPGWARITPAHAGKSRGRSFCPTRSWDHPRACGEKPRPRTMVYRPIGSPPRMRGKVDYITHFGFDGGITPAHAGKRKYLYQAGQCRRDHPRACGEKPAKAVLHTVQRGSPPRMRGKGICSVVPTAGQRITPAHAGKRGKTPSPLSIV